MDWWYDSSANSFNTTTYSNNSWLFNSNTNNTSGLTFSNNSNGYLNLRDSSSSSILYQNYSLRGGASSGYDRSVSSVNHATRELNNNAGDWAWWNWRFEMPHNKCNEFLYAAFGGSGSGYPTVLRENGYYVPNISNLADPEFARTQLGYTRNLNDKQPGDMMIWYSKSLEVHHGGLYVGDDRVIHASFEGLKVNTVDYITTRQRNVEPVIRRLK